MLNEICRYFICFMVFSFIGWVYESVFYSVQLKRFVNSHRAGLTKSEAELLTEVLNNRIVFYYNAKSCEMMEALQQQ